jgi:hypothetical protein
MADGHGDGTPGPEATADADADVAATADSLLRWALASFHAATLLVAPLTLLYAVDALGSLLQGVHTVTGLGLYLALWGLTWWTNGRWLAATRLDGLRETIRPAATWGAVTGFGFLIVLLVAVGLSVREPVLVAVLALVGAPVSALVGAVVGTGFAVVDLLIVSAGKRLAEAA